MSFDPIDPREPLRAHVVAPASSAHRVIGALNIVFACILSACGLCGGGYTMMILISLPSIAETEARMAAQRAMDEQARRSAEIERLTAQREGLESAAEQAALDEQIAQLENLPVPAPQEQIDFDPLVGNPLFVAYPAVDLLSAMILNLAMLVSGVGLLFSREWARRLAISVAGVKIFRLVTLYAVFVFVVVPAAVNAAGELIQQAEQIEQRQPGPGKQADMEMARQFVMMYSTMISVGAVGMIVLGSVYPAISLWILTRPGVRIACGAPIDTRTVTPT